MVEELTSENEKIHFPSHTVPMIINEYTFKYLYGYFNTSYVFTKKKILIKIKVHDRNHSSNNVRHHSQTEYRYLMVLLLSYYVGRYSYLYILADEKLYG